MTLRLAGERGECPFGMELGLASGAGLVLHLRRRPGAGVGMGGSGSGKEGGGWGGERRRRPWERSHPEQDRGGYVTYTLVPPKRKVVQYFYRFF